MYDETETGVRRDVMIGEKRFSCSLDGSERRGRYYSSITDNSVMSLFD